MGILVRQLFEKESSTYTYILIDQDTREGMIIDPVKETLDRDIQSLNYSIDTVQNVIYLMGVAQDQEELNQVIEHGRTIPNVQRIVSYVKLAGEPLENSQDYTVAP